MYQFHSSTFEPWQHYYHQRLNGPLFLTDQRVKINKNGLVAVTSSRRQQAWVWLWNNKVLKDKDLQKSNNNLIITSWIKTKTWKLNDNEDAKFLHEIVKNLSGSILKKYTFQFGDQQIRYSKILPSQICRLLDMLKPTEVDRKRRKYIETLMRKSTNKVPFYTKKSTSELQNELSKLTIESSSGETTQTDVSDSDSAASESEDDEEYDKAMKRAEEKNAKIERLKNDILKLRKELKLKTKNYDFLNPTLDALEKSKKRLENQIEKRKAEAATKIQRVQRRRLEAKRKKAEERRKAATKIQRMARRRLEAKRKDEEEALAEADIFSSDDEDQTPSNDETVSNISSDSSSSSSSESDSDDEDSTPSNDKTPRKLTPKEEKEDLKVNRWVVTKEGYYFWVYGGDKYENGNYAGENHGEIVYAKKGDIVFDKGFGENVTFNGSNGNDLKVGDSPKRTAAYVRGKLYRDLKAESETADKQVDELLENATPLTTAEKNEQLNEKVQENKKSKKPKGPTTKEIKAERSAKIKNMKQTLKDEGYKEYFDLPKLGSKMDEATCKKMENLLKDLTQDKINVIEEIRKVKGTGIKTKYKANPNATVEQLKAEKTRREELAAQKAKDTAAAKAAKNKPLQDKKLRVDKYNRFLEWFNSTELPITWASGKKDDVVGKLTEEQLSEYEKKLGDNWEKKYEIVEQIREKDPSYTTNATTTAEQLQMVLKEKERLSTREVAADKFDANVDMAGTFDLDIDPKLGYTEYMLENDKNSIQQLGILSEYTFTTVVAPGDNFDVVHVSKDEIKKTTLSGWVPCNENNRFRNGKKTLEVIEIAREGTEGMSLHVKMVKPEGNYQLTPQEVPVRQIDSDDEDDFKTNTEGGIKYVPKEAQNVTIHAVGKDVLISHAPGKGKTFNAILRAEKARNEKIFDMKKDLPGYTYDPDCEPNAFTKENADPEWIPRILIVGPKASIVSQWQDEVINNKFDPRHYIFQTNAFFRRSFTIGGYPKWDVLDENSKKMITETCWKGSQDGNYVKWDWKGKENEPHVQKYLDGIVDPDPKDPTVGRAHTHFMPELPLRGSKYLTRSDMKKLLLGKKSKYVTDSISNKHLMMRESKGSLLWVENLLMDQVNMDKHEIAVWNVLVSRPDLMQIYEEDIFLYYVPNKQFDVNTFPDLDTNDEVYLFYAVMQDTKIKGKVPDPIPKFEDTDTWNNTARGRKYIEVFNEIDENIENKTAWSKWSVSAIGYYLGLMNLMDENETEQWKKDKENIKNLPKRDQVKHEIKAMSSYAGFYWFFTNLKVGPYLSKNFDPDGDEGDTIGDPQTEQEDVTAKKKKKKKKASNKNQEEFDINNYTGSVPFDSRIYKAEIIEDETSPLEKEEAYDPTRFLEFLTGSVFSYDDGTNLGMKPDQNSLFGSGKFDGRKSQPLRGKELEQMDKLTANVEFDLEIPKEIRQQAQTSLETEEDTSTEPMMSKFDTIRDFKTKYLELMLDNNSEDYIRASVIDKFVDTTHGVDLSQHRYQAEKGCIFVLDEAHEPTAITDNLNKISTKIIFDFAKDSTANIFVTATPMQSESPQQQLWNFSQVFRKKGYQEIQKQLEERKNGINEEKILSKKRALVDKIQKKNPENDTVQSLMKLSLKELEEKYETIKDLYKKERENKEKKALLKKLLLSRAKSDEIIELQAEIAKEKSERAKESRREKKYIAHFKIVQDLKKIISRSFEIQPIQRENFLNSVLTEREDYKILECFQRIIKLYLWGNERNFDYFKSLENTVKTSVLRQIGRNLLKVRSGDFTNSFPAKLKMFTIYDLGRIPVEMDNVRKNLCSYAGKRTSSNKRLIQFNYTSERSYFGELNYNPYENALPIKDRPNKKTKLKNSTEESEDTYSHRNFDRVTSYKMLDECQRRIIPIVIKRSKFKQYTQKQNFEVDTRMMATLQDWAFNTSYHIGNDNKKTQSVFILPLLADNLDEAKSLLGKVMLKRYSLSNACVQDWAEADNSRAAFDKVPEIIKEYYDDCRGKIGACWGSTVNKEDVLASIEVAKRKIKLADLGTNEEKEKRKKEANDELSDWKTIYAIREKFKKVTLVEEDVTDISDTISGGTIGKYKDTDGNETGKKYITLGKSTAKEDKVFHYKYEEWRNMKEVFDIRWLPYECQLNDNGRKRVMPFIPPLMSSKYRAIVKLMMEKDKDHTNGIVYHKNYQVHYHLGRTLEAYGAKYVQPKTRESVNTIKQTFEDYYRPLIENAKKKILRKWTQFMPPNTDEDLNETVPEHMWAYTFRLHDNKQEGRKEAKNVYWDPKYEIERLKYWGLYMSKEAFEEEQKKVIYNGEKDTIKDTKERDEEGNKVKEAYLDNLKEWVLVSELEEDDDRDTNIIDAPKNEPKKTFKSRHYAPSSITDDNRGLKELHIYIRKLGEELEKVETTDKTKYIEYVRRMRRNKNDSRNFEIDKVYKLKKPIPITHYGRYDIVDEDEEFSHNEEFMEGRNTSQEQEGGLSGNFPGFFIEPSNKDEYIRYISKNKYADAGKEMTYSYGSSTEKLPSLGKITLIEKIKRLLKFTIDTREKQQDGEKLDEDINIQKRLMDLVKKAHRLSIPEVISKDDEESLVANYNTVLTELKQLEEANENMDNFYKEINEHVLYFIKLHAVAKVGAYMSTQFQEQVYPRIQTNLNPYIEELKNKCKELEAKTYDLDKRQAEIEKGTYMQSLVEFKYQDREQLKLYKNKIEKEGGVKAKKNKMTRVDLAKLYFEEAVNRARKITLRTFNVFVATNLNIFAAKLREKYKGKRGLKARLKYISPEDIEAIKNVEYAKKYLVAAKKKAEGRKKDKLNPNQQKYRQSFLKSIGDAIKDEYKDQLKKDTEAFSKQPTIENFEKVIQNTVKAGQNVTWQLDNGDEKRTVEIETQLHRRSATGAPTVAMNYATPNDTPVAGSSEKSNKDYQYLQNAPNCGLGFQFQSKPTIRKMKKLAYDREEKEEKLKEANKGKKEKNKIKNVEEMTVNSSEARWGLRLQTLPSNVRNEDTKKIIYERLLAMNNDTFLSFAKYTGKASSKDRDIIKQLHESGLIDYILMSDAGTTGVDFQSTRRSIMILAQPGRSPGAEDQFVGRLVRNVSHGIIPKLYQRVEYVTFYNDVSKAVRKGEESKQLRTYPYLTKKDWERIRKSYKDNLITWVAKRQTVLQREEEDKRVEASGGNIDGLIADSDEEEDDGNENYQPDDDANNSGNKSGSGSGSGSGSDSDSDSDSNPGVEEQTANVDIEEEYSSEEEAALPINEVLEGNMLYVSTRPKKKPPTNLDSSITSEFKIDDKVIYNEDEDTIDDIREKENVDGEKVQEAYLSKLEDWVPVSQLNKVEETPKKKKKKNKDKDYTGEDAEADDDGDDDFVVDADVMYLGQTYWIVEVRDATDDDGNVTREAKLNDQTLGWIREIELTIMDDDEGWYDDTDKYTKFKEKLENNINPSNTSKATLQKIYQFKERIKWMKMAMRIKYGTSMPSRLEKMMMKLFFRKLPEALDRVQNPDLKDIIAEDWEKADLKVKKEKEKMDEGPVPPEWSSDDDSDVPDDDNANEQEEVVESNTGVGGKLDKNIDFHIDNHVNISHVICVGKLFNTARGDDESWQWRGNHVFTNIRQLLDHDFKTCCETKRQLPYKFKDIRVVEEEDGKFEVKDDEDDEDAYSVGKFRVPKYEEFGISCYVCHAENKWDADQCIFCGTNIENTRYYKMQHEYLRVKPIRVNPEKTTEHSTLCKALYPVDRKLRMSSDPEDVDRWTKDKNIIYNYKNGFNANIAERDRLRFYYSMVTVEHYFNQQTDQIVDFKYEGAGDEKGTIYVRQKNDNPYGMKKYKYGDLSVRSTPWNELVWPNNNPKWPKYLSLCDKSVSVGTEGAKYTSGQNTEILKFLPPSETFGLDLTQARPVSATIIPNTGGGECGYLAFGQWLRINRNIDVSCTDLRAIVGNFDLDNEKCGLLGRDGDSRIPFETRQKIAQTPGEYMQTPELKMLACHYNVCVNVYKDYEKEENVNGLNMANLKQDTVTYSLIEPKYPEPCKETMWLYNSYKSYEHYELLVDVKYETAEEVQERLNEGVQSEIEFEYLSDVESEYSD